MLDVGDDVDDHALMKKVPYTPKLPIKPTAKPKGDDIAKVAMASLDVSQLSLLSPAAVITALRCALDVYERNVFARGMTMEVIQQCEDLGEQMAELLLRPKTKKEPGIVDSTGAELTKETGLVGPDGKPLTMETSTGDMDPEDATSIMSALDSISVPNFDSEAIIP